MSEIWLLTTAIVAPVLCGIAGMMLPRKELALRVGLSVMGPGLTLVLLALYVQDHGFHSKVWSTPWMPSLGLTLQLNADHLGLFFAFLVSGIGLLITLYARAYFGPDVSSLYRFYPTLLLFMTAMIGVVLADNFVLLLLFWEMTSVSSFLLIGWERDNPSAVKKAMQAFVVTGAGGLAMMAGLILLGLSTGHWAFSDLQTHGLTSSAATTTAFLLIFAGAAAKSAQFPLHFWLPGAMSAPTPVSAYLHSATMVKAGVYLTGRMWPIMAAALPIWPQLIVPLGAVTMVYGAFIAIQKTDLKQIFAYTTVSQLGLLMCMYGLSAFEYQGEPNLIWGVTQIFNHALYKAPLFILAGAIGHVASRELPELKGFFWRNRTSRIMTVVLLLAAYGLAAGPGTLSFTAKEFFFYQIYHSHDALSPTWFWLLVAAGIATGMFNVAIFFRLVRTLVFEKPDSHAHGDAHGHGAGAHHGDHEHETGLWPAFLWIPGLVIVSFQFVGGLVPNLFFHGVLKHIEPNMIYHDHLPNLLDVVTHPSFPLYMSLIAIALGVTVGYLPVLRKIYQDPFDHAYPGFYRQVTQVVGPKLFGFVQTGHLTSYIAFVAISIVGLFLWTIRCDPTWLASQWPDGARFESEQPGELMLGALVASVVCLTAVLLPIVIDRASRVLMLGTCGFAVTAVYYLYRAPDLALTQISIEIVSLVLFLLVLSLIPREAPKARLWVAPRIVLSLAVGGVMFWLTLTSSVGPRPELAATQVGNTTIPHLGEYFLRNSHHGVDTAHLPEATLASGVVVREQTGGHQTDDHADHQAEGAFLHDGGGGNNVVNVILVDFRGFDTMGEITVLALAAMGVWTLLRVVRRSKSGDQDDDEWFDDEDASSPRADSLWRVDIPEPSVDFEKKSTNDPHWVHRSLPS